mgnify:FL=1
MIDTLRTLPCFKQVESISKITSGLSQHCFKVVADNNIYFVKTIEGNTEVLVTSCAVKSGLSPNIIYHDQDWLVTRFIEADNMALSTLNIDDKISYSIRLMAQCHQLHVKPAVLSPKGLINDLLDNSYYSQPQKTALLALANLLIEPIYDCKNNVCCHGDLNFSNVLMSEELRTWLIDYECACNAPAEYDLAMFIAINGLASDKIIIIIEQYQVQSSSNVDPLLLNSYLRFGYFINALWYFNSYHQETHIERKQALLEYAEKQWSALQSSFEQGNSTLFNSLSSKLTNILSAFNFKNQT